MSKKTKPQHSPVAAETASVNALVVVPEAVEPIVETPTVGHNHPPEPIDVDVVPAMATTEALEKGFRLLKLEEEAGSASKALLAYAVMRMHEEAIKRGTPDVPTMAQMHSVNKLCTAFATLAVQSAIGAKPKLKKQEFATFAFNEALRTWGKRQRALIAACRIASDLAFLGVTASDFVESEKTFRVEITRIIPETCMWVTLPRSGKGSMLPMYDEDENPVKVLIDGQEIAYKPLHDPLAGTKTDVLDLKLIEIIAHRGIPRAKDSAKQEANSKRTNIRSADTTTANGANDEVPSHKEPDVFSLFVKLGAEIARLKKEGAEAIPLSDFTDKVRNAITLIVEFIDKARAVEAAKESKAA